MRRIAICLNGQPRTWKKCIQNWRDTFGDWGQIDFFFHFWDYNSPASFALYTNGLNPVTDTSLNKILTEEEKQEIIDALKPKKYMFESIKSGGEVLVPNLSVENIIAGFAHSQFYSLRKSVFLKRQYEIENNFEYDIVIRLRADIFFDPTLPFPPPGRIEPKTIYSCHNTTIYGSESHKNFFTTRVGDIFFLSDSLTMDHLSMFYDALSFIDAAHVTNNRELNFPPELALYYYCAMSGIINKPILPRGNQIKVMRDDEHLKLTGKLESYEKI